MRADEIKRSPLKAGFFQRLLLIFDCVAGISGAIQGRIAVCSCLLFLSLGAISLGLRSAGLVLGYVGLSLRRIGARLQVAGVGLGRIRLSLLAGRIGLGVIGLSLRIFLLHLGAGRIGLGLVIIRARLFVLDRLGHDRCCGQRSDRCKSDKFHIALPCMRLGIKQGRTVEVAGVPRGK